MFRIQNIRYIFLLSLLVLTAMSYYPSFANVVTLEGGENPLNRYFVLLTVITFLLYFNYQGWIKNQLIRTYLIYLIIAGIIGFLLAQMAITTQYESATRGLLMAFVFLAIGYNSKLSYRQLFFLAIVYSLSVAFVTYRQLIQHAGGFVITDLYLGYGKNTLGVMCAASCILLLILFFYERNRYLKLFLLLLYVYILVLCISIRARADFLIIFLVTALCIYKNMRRNKLTMKSISWIVFGGLFVFVVFIFSPQIFQSILDYIIDSFTRNREGDLATGREVGWQRAIDVISESPLWGNMELQRNYETLTIHNYFLRQLSSFGILGSIPILLLYLFLFVYVIKRIIISPISVTNVGFYTFVILLAVSFGEPTFPYSPGTGVILPFMLLGFTLFRVDNPQNNFYK